MRLFQRSPRRKNKAAALYPYTTRKVFHFPFR